MCLWKNEEVSVHRASGESGDEQGEVIAMGGQLGSQGFGTVLSTSAFTQN